MAALVSLMFKSRLGLLLPCQSSFVDWMRFASKKAGGSSKNLGGKESQSQIWLQENRRELCPCWQHPGNTEAHAVATRSTCGDWNQQHPLCPGGWHCQVH